MNETIGEKGGHNDRIRTFRIKEKKKKKKKEIEEDLELKELERKVKRSQRIVFIKTIPLIIAGTTLKTLYDVARTKKVNDKASYKLKDIEDIDKEKEDEEIIILEDGRKIKVKRNKGIKEEKSIEEIKQEIKEKIEEEQIDNTKEIEKTIEEKRIEEDEFVKLSEEAKKKLEKLKSHKIIEEYEKDLKDVRYDLRKLVYDYDKIVEDEEKIVFKEEAEEILDRLSTVIDKMNELKEKIKINNLEDYDDNYIYTLIEDYLKEFKDGRSIPGFKDSSLYIMLSDKLDELEEKSTELNNKVNERKEKLKEKEDNYRQLENNYSDFRKINQELLQFQNEQDHLLKEIREKIDNAKTESEKVEIEVHAMNRQSRRLLNLLALSMFIPGKKSSKTLAASMAAYLYFVNQLMHRKTTTRKYRVISVVDYREKIENALTSIDDGVLLLNKTDKQIDKVIKEINEKYKDYLVYLPECRQLLSNLHKMKSEINEKEYELEKIKMEEEKLLKENEAKLLTRGKYEM